MPSSRASSLYSSPVHHSPAPPKLDLADAHSQLYQTPSTTSASSSLFQTISTSSCKRSCTGSSDKRCSLYDFSAAATHDGDDHLYRSSWLGRDENVAGIEYDHPDIHGELPLAPPIDASVDLLSSHTGNGRKRSHQEQQEGAQDKKDITLSAPPASWGQSVMNVVGKVWSFCWSGARPPQYKQHFLAVLTLSPPKFFFLPKLPSESGYIYTISLPSTTIAIRSRFTEIVINA